VSEKHCATCICGKRAPVQASRGIADGLPGHGPGSVDWAEHELAWSTYAAKNGLEQSAQRIADRGGFGYGELVDYHLAHAPLTWVPAGAVTERGDRR
jgi:hypothetical protein